VTPYRVDARGQAGEGVASLHVSSSCL
jgi:hypothetical protein